MIQPLKKKTSPRGVQFIKDGEGCSLRAYKCPAGVWTIGYGHTSASGSPVVFEKMTITQREADEILKSDLRKFEEAINRLVQVPLNQSQFDALVSLSFNIGIDRFGKSTLLKKLNAGDYDAVPNEMMRWNRIGKKVSKGLTNRRAKEAALWVDDEWEVDEEPTPQGNITRSVPTIINTENVNAAAAVATGVGAMNLDGSNPMAWAFAAIAVASAAVFLFLFIKRRGA